MLYCIRFERYLMSLIMRQSLIDFASNINILHSASGRLVYLFRSTFIVRYCSGNLERKSRLIRTGTGIVETKKKIPFEGWPSGPKCHVCSFYPLTKWLASLAASVAVVNSDIVDIALMMIIIKRKCRRISTALKVIGFYSRLLGEKRVSPMNRLVNHGKTYLPFIILL